MEKVRAALSSFYERRKSETEARRNEERYIFRRRGLNALDISWRPVPLSRSPRPPSSDPPFFRHHRKRPTGSRAPESRKHPLAPAELPSFGLPILYVRQFASLARTFIRGGGWMCVLRRVTCEMNERASERVSESTLSTRIIHRALK